MRRSPEIGHFWSEALGWPLVWVQDDETAIRDPHSTGPLITWGPPVPAPTATCRLHLDVAPSGQGQSGLDSTASTPNAVCRLGRGPHSMDAR